MNRLEALLKLYCPNGVDFVPVGDVVDYEQPSPYIVRSTNYSDEYDIPVLTPGQSFILGYTNESEGVYCASKTNPAIIFDDFTGAFKWVDFNFKVKSSAMKILTVKSNRTIIRYIYHVMGKIGFSSDEHKRLWISFYSAQRIPLPPLEVQEEIVRILDSFTALAAELAAELAARKKQYEFYRDKLLSFDDLTPEERARLGVRWMTIKDLSTSICSGGTPLKSRPNNYNGNIPWLRTQEVTFNEIHSTECSISEEGLKNSSAKWIPENCVIVAISGATAARCAINKIPLTTNQHCCNIQVNPKIALYRYVFHWFSSQYLNLKSKGRGAREDITTQIIANYPICVPSINEQERIVEILDSFDSLCSNLSDGIPAEIYARQKQYEYYRDKILSFAEDKT